MREGDDLEIRLEDERIEVNDRTTKQTVSAVPITGVMLKILTAGGLVPYVRGRP